MTTRPSKLSTRPKPHRSFPEHQLQSACIKWFCYKYNPSVVTMFAIPNGGARNKRTGAMLKAEGVLPGVADLFLMSQDKDKQHCGLFIEMKVGKNSQTEEQLLFEARATFAGYQYKVCRSLDEFMVVVDEYLGW